MVIDSPDGIAYLKTLKELLILTYLVSEIPYLRSQILSEHRLLLFKLLIRIVHLILLRPVLDLQLLRDNLDLRGGLRLPANNHRQAKLFLLARIRCGFVHELRKRLPDLRETPWRHTGH